jgi:WD40 repeat protein
MQATDKFLYGLTFKGDLVIRNADNLSEVVKTKANAAKADATCMAVSEVSNTIWLGDKTGAVTVLDADTLEPVELPAALKTKQGAASHMAASPGGGALIALGDAKGFVSVFDTATKTLKVYFARNQSKIYDITFNEDSSWVQCVSQDKILSMSNVENRDDRKVL